MIKISNHRDYKTIFPECRYAENCHSRIKIPRRGQNLRQFRNHRDPFALTHPLLRPGSARHIRLTSLSRTRPHPVPHIGEPGHGHIRPAVEKFPRQCAVLAVQQQCPSQGLGKNAFPHFISPAKARRRKEKRGNPPAGPLLCVFAPLRDFGVTCFF